ncbi:putative ATP5-F1F0-ATPase complex, OSCP subunit [Microstroma glucosiphilum]|uniref:ATP synthase subunit 5, mitochondrial n=1 Tax=Pseudomicrostroma glucosiphilum TaxID=1684307 RepID=A0A316U1N8_9BASI|nr:putative ATP5-F1F0-ATPase complex, OSCP subunit [Pseudomicrostroma glucosiphilum]PWN19110.1 putative ATP5-F1F0-ATPase complex, OSCP subunit [Pseudomicrostroma glucosiphilum]
MVARIFSKALQQSTRGYASQAAVKPPILLNGLPGKYASSAYVAALGKSERTLQAVEKDLQAVQANLGPNAKDAAKLQTFISNPTLSNKDKVAGLEQLIGNKSDTITRNLFEVLAENGRLGDAEKVVEEFFRLMAAHRGEVEVTITSAAPLDKSHSQRLEQALSSSGVAKASGGQKIKFNHKVNPSIQGGLVVDFGDRSVDLSVAGKVRRLNALLQESV